MGNDELRDQEKMNAGRLAAAATDADADGERAGGRWIWASAVLIVGVRDT